MTPWSIRYEDNVWPSEGITVTEGIDIALVAGGAWDALDPYSHPGALAAIVAVLIASRLDVLLEEALAKVRSMTLADLMGCLVEVPEAVPGRR